MKVAALDVGQARIGLAVGEVGSPWAFGRGYLVRRTPQADVLALRAFAERERVAKLIVGLPLRTDGTPSAQAARVLELVRALREAGLEVETFDERFTTQLGARRLGEAPRRVRQEKGKLDEAAAVALLEGYLCLGKDSVNEQA